MFVYEIGDHVFVSTNRNILSQMGLCSVQPVTQRVQSISESSREQQGFL